MNANDDRRGNDSVAGRAPENRSAPADEIAAPAQWSGDTTAPDASPGGLTLEGLAVDPDRDEVAAGRGMDGAHTDHDDGARLRADEGVTADRLDRPNG